MQIRLIDAFTIQNLSFQQTMDIIEKRLIGGWMTGDELHWLYTQARTAHTILEIGTFKGRSTFALCAGLGNSGGTVFTVDHFHGSPALTASGHGGEMATPQGRHEVIEGVRLKLHEFFSMGRLFLLECPSRVAYDHLALVCQHRKFDFIFIDGDHTAASVKQDIEGCLGLLHPMGLIAGHDYKPHEHPGLCAQVDSHFPQRGVVPGTSIWFAYPNKHQTSATP